MARLSKKKKKKKESLKIANANKIVPIRTEESINQRLLKMTGDKKRYGGGPTRKVKGI
tara:strand:- start:66 stop:239 length:174 start_codon:yes stop_codon:yes gene_type:complete